MAGQQYQQLSQDDIDHFMKHGWIKLSGCFTQEQVDKLTSTLWTRLGMSPTDKSTWHGERINMPRHATFPANEFAPKAWSAICDLLGGEDRIAQHNRTWNDGFIVNLGSPEGEGKDIGGRDLPGWHVDGDFFVHYLDSPEQGLLVIPLFTDINPDGGGTFICPDAIPVVRSICMTIQKECHLTWIHVHRTQTWTRQSRLAFSAILQNRCQTSLSWRPPAKLGMCIYFTL